jgi:hypothetical protein
MKHTREYSGESKKKKRGYAIAGDSKPFYNWFCIEQLDLLSYKNNQRTRQDTYESYSNTEMKAHVAIFKFSGLQNKPYPIRQPKLEFPHHI